MDAKAQKLYSSTDRSISIDIVPGHFVTNHSHINYYVNLTNLKIRHTMAQAGASVLANKLNFTPIDTILCLEGTEVVGAFLANKLSKESMSLSYKNDINVLTPESNNNNQMIFRKNTVSMVTGKNVLLLLSTVSTGKTIKRLIECIEYYSGVLSGIGALFSAAESINGADVHSIFSIADIPEYKTFSTSHCEMCAEKIKVDAIVNSHGYSKL